MSEIVKAETAVVRRENDFMPTMTIQQAIDRRNAFLMFQKDVMKSGVDFGEMPGTGKPTLLKPGAEKLCTLFGLTPRSSFIEKVEDWTGKDHGGEPHFFYHVKISLYRNEQFVAEADGSCNSWEKKYRFRWLPESELPAGFDKVRVKTKSGTIREPAFAVDKAETSGRFGKPAEYWDRFITAIQNGTARSAEMPKRGGGVMEAWEIGETMYRVPNEDIFDAVNTIQKMAFKRALVACTLIATNASEVFSQDQEDLIESSFTPEQMVQHSVQIESRPVAPVQPPIPPDADEPESTFEELWATGVIARGGSESDGSKLLAGLLQRAKKTLRDVDGAGRRELLKKLASGTYDKFLVQNQQQAAPVTNAVGSPPAEVVGDEFVDCYDLTEQDYRAACRSVAESVGTPLPDFDKALSAHMGVVIGKTGPKFKTMTQQQKNSVLVAIKEGRLAASGWITAKV